MKKITALLLTAILAFSIFTACSKANAEQPQGDTGDNISDTEAHDDSITIVMESEPTTLNPYDHAAVTSGYMNQLTYNKLFRVDVDTLEPVPDLCDTYENVD